MAVRQIVTTSSKHQRLRRCWTVTATRVCKESLSTSRSLRRMKKWFLLWDQIQCVAQCALHLKIRRQTTRKRVNSARLYNRCNKMVKKKLSTNKKIVIYRVQCSQHTVILVAINWIWIVKILPKAWVVRRACYSKKQLRKLKGSRLKDQNRKT